MDCMNINKLQQYISYLMYMANNTNSKRDNFRQQIRRRQVEQIFAQNRKNYPTASTQLEEYQPANSTLIKRCLIQNELLQQLPTLLPSLSQKIKSNPSPSNLEFVLTVSCNIMLDSITLDQKQYIYSYCMAALKGTHFTISPLVEVYFYMTVMNGCYGCLEERDQVEIQELVLPRLIGMLDYQKIDVSRAPTQYTDTQCRSMVLQDALTALLYFYTPDTDHNNILLYKTKRTTKTLATFLNWLQQTLQKLQKFQNFPQLLHLINIILNNISTIPYNLTSLLSAQCVGMLVRFLITQLWFQEEVLEEVKQIGVGIFVNLGQEDFGAVFGAIGEHELKLLLSQLEKSVNICYQTQLIRLFSVLLTSQETRRLQQNSIHQIIYCVISVVVKIISDREQETDEVLLKQSLILIRDVASLGFEQGNSDYTNYMCGMGVSRLLDGLYIKIKNQDLIDLIDQIYSFIDIC